MFKRLWCWLRGHHKWELTSPRMGFCSESAGVAGSAMYNPFFDFRVRCQTCGKHNQIVVNAAPFWSVRFTNRHETKATEADYDRYVGGIVVHNRKWGRDV